MIDERNSEPRMSTPETSHSQTSVPHEPLSDTERDELEQVLGKLIEINSINPWITPEDQVREKWRRSSPAGFVRSTTSK